MAAKFRQILSPSVILLRMCKLLRFLSNMAVSAVRKSSRERKPVLRLIDKVSASQKPSQKDLDLLGIEADEAKSRKRRDNKFYEVEIAEVDKENRKMKLHFKGYRHRYDECGGIIQMWLIQRLIL